MNLKASILAIGTALPEHTIDQLALGRQMSQLLQLDEQQSAWTAKLYERTGIRKRHTVLQDFQPGHKRGIYWDANQHFLAPSTQVRNTVYKQEAPRLAYSAAVNALQAWGGDYKAITHLIFVSCTGMMAPGVQHDLTHTLPLNPSVNQIAINFMGCFGAFKGIDVAAAYAQSNPKHRILVVCTELCSLHFQSTFDSELQVANALFADGAAAIVVGGEPTLREKPLWKIHQSLSYSIPGTSDRMTWDATDQGFCMGLKADVPDYIKQTIPGFVQRLLPEGLTFHQCDWPVHPGGKSILKSIEEACTLTSEQTQASWKVLADYGNMSSPTFLFVLEELLRKPSLKPWSIGLGFGPGLTIEGVLLENCTVIN